MSSNALNLIDALLQLYVRIIGSLLLLVFAIKIKYISKYGEWMLIFNVVYICNNIAYMKIIYIYINEKYL